MGRARQVLWFFTLTFVLAVAFSFLSDSVLRATTLFLAALVLVFIVLLGIIFDIIGLATATASHASLHAMAAKRLPGARHALRLARNAPRVAVVCNDVVGDLCGTVSGAAGTAIVFHVGLSQPGAGGGIWTILIVAMIAAVTVGGKAFGKNFALERADTIVYDVGRILWWLEEKLGLVILREPNSRRTVRRKADTP